MLGIPPTSATVHHAGVRKAVKALTGLQGLGLSTLLLASTLTSQGGVGVHLVWGSCQSGSWNEVIQDLQPSLQSHVSSLACPG